MILLDYQDRRPLYEQISEKFRTLIISGALPPGEKMPSVRQLAMELSINPNTIQRAYMELEQQGLIYPVKGRGNFVTDNRNIQRISYMDYQKELSALLKKGRDMGVPGEEIRKLVDAYFSKGQEEKDD